MTWYARFLGDPVGYRLTEQDAPKAWMIDWRPRGLVIAMIGTTQTRAMVDITQAYAFVEDSDEAEA